MTIPVIASWVVVGWILMTEWYSNMACLIGSGDDKITFAKKGGLTLLLKAMELYCADVEVMRPICSVLEVLVDNGELCAMSFEETFAGLQGVGRKGLN